MRRAAAYLDAGADCIFVPGVSDGETIGRLAAAIPGPLNVLAMPSTPPVPELGRLGVARVERRLRARPCRAGWTRSATATMLETGSFAPLADAVPFAELGELLDRRL